MSASPAVFLCALFTVRVPLNILAKRADFCSTFGYLSFGRHRSKAKLFGFRLSSNTVKAYLRSKK